MVGGLKKKKKKGPDKMVKQVSIETVSTGKGKKKTEKKSVE